MSQHDTPQSTPRYAIGSSDHDAIRRAFATCREEIDAQRRHSERYESAFDVLLNANAIEECGCCGQFHPAAHAQEFVTPDPRSDYYGGDCRDDRNRF